VDGRIDRETDVRKDIFSIETHTHTHTHATHIMYKKSNHTSC